MYKTKVYIPCYRRSDTSKTRDVHETFQTETRPETQRSETETSRDVGHFVRDETETETLRVRDETETFQLPRPWPRRMVKTIKNHKIN